jgi:hypothetical protein
MSCSKKGSSDPKAKQNAIESIQNFLSQISAPERKKVMAFAGSKPITPEGFLKHVKHETEFGLQIIDVHSAALKLDVELFKLHLEELFSPLVDALEEMKSLITGKSESSTNNRAIGKNTKNLLFIRPDIPGDKYTEQFAKPAAQLVYDKAQKEKWNITDLRGSKASKKNVNKALLDPNNSIDFVVHYDHGNPNAMMGWNKKPVIDVTNVKYLSGKGMSSVSCFSAFPILGVGQRAIDSGAIAFLGYNSFHCCENTFQMVFVYCANVANYALLEGKTFLDSYKIGLDTYKMELDKISKSNNVFVYPAYVLLASNSWEFQLLR